MEEPFARCPCIPVGGIRIVVQNTCHQSCQFLTQGVLVGSAATSTARFFIPPTSRISPPLIFCSACFLQLCFCRPTTPARPDQYTPALVCLLAREMRDTSQGLLTFVGGLKNRRPMIVPTRPYQERIGPRLLSERSRANKQTSIGLYLEQGPRVPVLFQDRKGRL